MDKIQYGSISYPDTDNVGDPIQTLAAEQFLPKIDYRIDRDSPRVSRKGREGEHCDEWLVPPSNN